MQKYLEERGIGCDGGVAKVPLVCQSCLFDSGLGRADARPNAAMAYAACADADRDAPAEGNAGAGIGCSVGKYRGMERAILRAVRAAKGAYGLPGYEDINMVQQRYGTNI